MLTKTKNWRQIRYYVPKFKSKEKISTDFFNNKNNLKIKDVLLKTRKSQKSKYIEDLYKKKKVNYVIKHKSNCTQEDAVVVVDNYAMQEKHDALICKGHLCQDNKVTNKIEISKEEITVTYTFTSQPQTTYYKYKGNNFYEKIIVSNEYIGDHLTTNKPIYMSGGLINIDQMSVFNVECALDYNYNNYQSLQTKSYLWQFLNKIKREGVDITDKNEIINYVSYNNKKLLMLEDITLINDTNDYLLIYDYATFNKINADVMMTTIFLKN